MIFKEELELLTGAPVEIFTGEPMEVPCNETSSLEKLCKNPVVSVFMLTYNQAPYIRQAIESVMMQKTDFEFELIIGEDCSTDCTRDICFELQKKYPEKIRVLWSDENLYRYGGNGIRTFARCRGEYIAFCEGDDYWTDPLKLQKQVDLMRKTGAVMCVANNELHYANGSMHKHIYEGNKHLLELRDLLGGHYFHTTTYLLDKKVWQNCAQQYKEIVQWYDVAMLLCMSTMGKICVLPESVSVYRAYNGISGGDQMDNAFAMLIATQQLQFEQCHNKEIADFYGQKVVKHLMKHIVLAKQDGKFCFPEVVRMRALKVARLVCRRRYGRLKEFAMMLRFWRKSGVASGRSGCRKSG